MASQCSAPECVTLNINRDIFLLGIAGLDWKILDQFNLSVNFVNLLLQNGTIGSIDMADSYFVCGEFIPLGSLRQICESYAFKNRHFS